MAAIGLAFVALAACAGAEEPPPVLHELQFSSGTRTTRAPNGAVLVALGRNLHQRKDDACRHDEVEVRLGSASCMVLGSTSDAIVFLVPRDDCPPGRGRLRVTIRGRGTATLDLEVVDPTRWQDESRTGRALGPKPDERPFWVLCARCREAHEPCVEYVWRGGPLRLRRFALDRDAQGLARFEALAQTLHLPEGATVRMALGLGAVELEARKVTVANGEMRATFGPYGRPLPSGTYALEVTFELAEQRPELARELRQASGVDPAVFERLQVGVTLQLGHDDEIGALHARVLALVQAHRAEIERIVAALEGGFGATARRLLRDPVTGAQDQAGHAAWLERVAPGELPEGEIAPSFATPEGALAAKELEAWATGLERALWRAAVRLDDLHRAWAVPPAPEVARLGRALRADAEALLHARVLALCGRAGVPVPDALRRRTDEAGEGTTGSGAVVRARLDGHLRALELAVQRELRRAE